MPHLRLRNVNSEQAADLSQSLLPLLAAVTQTPEDHFTLELIATSFFRRGKATAGEPFCEVLWFDRGQELQDQVAGVITKQLQQTAPGKDVVVTFGLFLRSAYYENGSHF